MELENDCCPSAAGGRGGRWHWNLELPGSERWRSESGELPLGGERWSNGIGEWLLPLGSGRADGGIGIRSCPAANGGGVRVESCPSAANGGAMELENGCCPSAAGGQTVALEFGAARQRTVEE